MYKYWTIKIIQSKPSIWIHSLETLHISRQIMLILHGRQEMHIVLNWSIVDKTRSPIKYSLILHKRQFRNWFYSTKAQKVVDNSTIWRRFVTPEWVGDCLNYLLGVITSRRMVLSVHGTYNNLRWKKEYPQKVITRLHRIWNISFHSFHLRCHKIA